jgi:hypothetical protein
MKKLPLLVIVAISIASVGRAAPPTIESVDRLLVAAKLDSTIDSMAKNVDRSVRHGAEQAIAPAKLTAADEKILSDLHAKMQTLIKQEMNWTKIKDVFEKVYVETYTQEQINGLIAFYTSPLGQVFAEKQAEITQKTGGLLQRRMMSVIVKVQGSAREAIGQIISNHQAPDVPEKSADAPAETPKPAPGSPAAVPAPASHS